MERRDAVEEALFIGEVDQVQCADGYQPSGLCRPPAQAFIHEHDLHLSFESEANGLILAFSKPHRLIQMLNGRDAQPNR